MRPDMLDPRHVPFASIPDWTWRGRSVDATLLDFCMHALFVKVNTIFG